MTAVDDHPEIPSKPGAGGRAAGLTGKGLQLAFIVVAAGMLCFFGRLPHARQQQVREVIRVFLGILLEAMPFMLVGALVGGLIEVFVSPEGLAKVLSGRRRRSVLVAAAMGVIFPVCECAIVPVVRRLVRKGAPLSAAVAFLLAGPIVNPIVAASTAVAYAGDWHVVAARLALGYVIAVVVGLAIGKVFQGGQALIPQGRDPHAHVHGGDGAPRRSRLRRFGGRLLEAAHHGASDFLDVGRFLVIGAFVTGVLRTLVRQEHLLGGGGDGPLAMLGMMGLAFVLNLCSEADAFVAASFRGLVGFSGQMAFMVLGPMLDLKLLAMYLALFRKRAIVALAVSIAAAVFLSIVLYGHLVELVHLCVLLSRRSIAS